MTSWLVCFKVHSMWKGCTRASCHANLSAHISLYCKFHDLPPEMKNIKNGIQVQDWTRCLQVAYSNTIKMLRCRELAAAGCPVDTRLPARVGDRSLQPSTLETWLSRLAQHGWPASPCRAGRALAVSAALLECAAAQGSRGRPELLVAAEAVGNADLVAAVQEVLPVLDPPCFGAGSQQSGGGGR